jgi:hypothetical protein
MILYPVLSKLNEECRKYGKSLFTAWSNVWFLLPQFSQTHDSAMALCGDLLYQFLPNQLRNIESMGRDSFRPLSKCDSLLLNTFCK